MRAAVLTMIFCLLAGCNDASVNARNYLNSGEASRAIGQEVHGNKSKQVDIAKLTRFDWDELILFTPYTPMSSVCERLALKADECAHVVTSESRDDGEMLMVFRRAGKVVHTEIHLRGNGDFLPLGAMPIRRDNAVFAVMEANEPRGKVRLMLRQKN